ncbi:MAG: MFS transporter, partial [Chloroflexota bacterium]
GRRHRNGAALGGWLRVALADRKATWIIAQFIIADAFIRIGGNLFVPFFNTYFVNHLGATTAWFGALRAVDRGIVVGATLLAAPLAVRFGPVVTITVTQLLSVPVLIVFGSVPTLLLASTTFLLRGTLMEMTVPLRDSFMMEVVPERVRATATATLSIAGQAIAFVVLPIGGLLLERNQYAVACAIAGGLYVAGALLYWRFFCGQPQAAPQRKVDLPALAG